MVGEVVVGARSWPLLAAWDTGYWHVAGTTARLSGGVRLTAPGLRARWRLAVPPAFRAAE
ncbi:hypothetical protein Vlu01_00210 [Micromonospora lutea]|uniref:Uncharacterized protein n=1 Tax=Micromonospora lutea TaxID=419825 RepID=A0ABQ4INB3_9ACTN|nr:hypothetical protein Vlu01_00210 [Micromonospora lutea]